MYDLEKLHSLVADGSLEAAAEMCRHALAAGEDQLQWLTQLGYVLFLNNEDDVAHYVHSVATFETIIQQYPLDVNAYFWLGYLQQLLLFQVEKSRLTLASALKLDALHPYANLIYGEMQQGLDRIARSITVLKVQPGNTRACWNLLRAARAFPQRVDVERILSICNETRPFLETRYGIMNDYINEVFVSGRPE